MNTATETRTIATAMHPGSFLAEEGESILIEGNPSDKEIRAKFEPDDGWFCIELVTRPWEKWTNGEAEKWEPVRGGKRTVRRIYIGAALDADDVAALPGDHHILLANMRGNGWDRVVQTRRGNFQPLEATDSVIAA